MGMRFCGARNRSVVRNGLPKELDLADLGSACLDGVQKHTCGESDEPGRLKVARVFNRRMTEDEAWILRDAGQPGQEELRRITQDE